jgi:LPS-assembly lipoprotein
MWWFKERTAVARAARLVAVLAAASLVGGCWQPLYGTGPTIAADSVQDKMQQVDIPPIPAPRGQPAARIAVSLRNSLQYTFNGGAGANAPIYTLKVAVATTQLSIIVDNSSGRPDAQVDAVISSYQLIEIATGKTVLTDQTTAHVDYDIPGSAQRFAKQRAQRDAEDRAVGLVSETIRNRLASYFVAGT